MVSGLDALLPFIASPLLKKRLGAAGGPNEHRENEFRLSNGCIAFPKTLDLLTTLCHEARKPKRTLSTLEESKHL